jgi:hypothetical protein
MSNMYCLVPLTVLTVSPYSLVASTTIIVKVRAHNSFGWSSYSTPNSAGAAMQTVPQKMTAPTMDVLSSNTQIIVDWTYVTTSPANGGSTVLSYGVMWD